MIGQTIVAVADPKGRFEEIWVSGTPSPGTFMEILPSTDKKGGRFTYRARSQASGGLGPVAVLCEDNLNGKTVTDAYQTGTLAKIYWPLFGEEINALLEESAGTGTSGEENIGDKLAIRNDGILMGYNSAVHTGYQFQLLEHGGVDTAGANLKLCKRIDGK